MNDKALTQIRQKLEIERDRLRQEIAEAEAEDREALSDASGENNYRDHMADQGSATFSRELDMTLEDNAREVLGQIERALERMDEGTYGICTRCGQPIGEGRLEAMPAAELCITCKEWEETH